MNSTTVRPENRRRDGEHGSAVVEWTDSHLAGLRSEAFAEDLPVAPPAELPRRPRKWRVAGAAPLLGLMLGALSR